MEFAEGLFALITIVISFIIGFGMIYKAIKTENKEIIPVGIFWVLLSSPWLAATTAFLFFGFFSIEIPDIIYLLLTQALVPLALLIWIRSYGRLTQLEIKDKLNIFYLIIVGIYLVLFYSFLFSNNPKLVELIGKREGIFNADFGVFILIFGMFGFLSIFITGLHFSIKTIKIGNKKARFQGIFLIIAFCLYTVGTLSDAFIPTIFIWLTAITRGIIILGGIFFYLAFFVPKWLKKYLVENQE